LQLNLFFGKVVCPAIYEAQTKNNQNCGQNFLSKITTKLNPNKTCRQKNCAKIDKKVQKTQTQEVNRPSQDFDNRHDRPIEQSQCNCQKKSTRNINFKSRQNR